MKFLKYATVFLTLLNAGLTATNTMLTRELDKQTMKEEVKKEVILQIKNANEEMKLEEITIENTE